MDDVPFNLIYYTYKIWLCFLVSFIFLDFLFISLDSLLFS